MKSHGHILFLHGLEGSPRGSKATHLKRKFGAQAIDLGTDLAQASSNEAKASGLVWDHTWPRIEADFEVPMARARAALRTDTQLVIGSSFGGAVLTRLLQTSEWAGPSLLLASAGLKLTGDPRLPNDVPIILLHGRGDTIVPLEHARTVAANAGPQTQLWEVDDEHRMKRALDAGIIDHAVRWLLAR